MCESLSEIILKVRPRAKLGSGAISWREESSYLLGLTRGFSVWGEPSVARKWINWVTHNSQFDEKDHPNLSTDYSFNPGDDINNDGIARQPPWALNLFLKVLRRGKNDVSSLGNKGRVWIIPGPTASITNVWTVTSMRCHLQSTVWIPTVYKVILPVMKLLSVTVYSLVTRDTASYQPLIHK